MSPASPKRGIADLMAEMDADPDTTTRTAELAPLTVAAVTPVPDHVHAALAVVPAPAPVPTVRRRKGDPAAEPWARVIAARNSALGEPGIWTMFTLRLPVDLYGELQRRWAADRARTGDRQLAVCHYIQAALEAVPFASTARTTALGEAWQAAHGIGGTLTRGSGTRLHRGTSRQLGELSDKLRLGSRRVYGWQVAAQAVAVLLAELDGTDGGETAGPGGNDGRPAEGGSGTSGDALGP
jgi:hypothetical protein